MTTKQNLVSKDVIRTRALSSGLARPQAWVMAILGYWSQMKGGVLIASGQKWQWREYAEIAAETGYSTKTIGRTVADLKASGLIEVKRIWHPNKPGTSLNAFRITDEARTLLDIPMPDIAFQFGNGGKLEKDKMSDGLETSWPNLTDHSGPTINTEPYKNQASESSIDTHVGGATPQFIKKRFGKDFLKDSKWESLDQNSLYNFWQGYKWLMKDKFNTLVGVYNKKREYWIKDYLDAFCIEQYSPWDALNALLYALQNWDEFNKLLQAIKGQPEYFGINCPDPYTLGVYGHVFLEFYTGKTWADTV